MTLGTVLDRAFRLYSDNFPLMFGITAILHAPILMVSLFVVLLPFVGNNLVLSTIVLLSTLIISLLTLILVYPLATAATTKAVSDKYLGNPVTIGSALSEAWGNVGTLLLTQIVVGIVVMLGFMLLVVPGILWMLSYALVPSVIMIEASNRKISRQVYSLTGDAKGASPMIMDRSDIRRRSWELVSGNRGKVFLTLFVFSVISLLLSGGGVWLAGIFFDPRSTTGATARSIISDLVSIAVSPLRTIAITLLYYDLRIRKEGSDLEMLSRALAGPAV